MAVSQCGSFGIIGYSCGSLHKFNMQSGLHRGEYSHPDSRAHNGEVVGCASDRFNRFVVSASRDGTLKLWTFKRAKLMSKFVIGSAVVAIHLHRGNALCAVAADDMRIRVFDCEAQRRVRQFQGPADRVTCLQMSEDGRWLLIASMDRTLRIYDIPFATQLHVVPLSFAGLE